MIKKPYIKLVTRPSERGYRTIFIETTDDLTDLYSSPLFTIDCQVDDEGVMHVKLFQYEPDKVQFHIGPTWQEQLEKWRANGIDVASNRGKRSTE